MNNYKILFLISFIGTIGITYILIKLLPYYGIVDIPNQRRAHRGITPRGGGLAIVIIIIISTVIYDRFFTQFSIYPNSILILLLIISIISFLDDILHLTITTRLITHIFCSSCFVLIFIIPKLLLQKLIPIYFDFLLSVLGLIAFLNIYNFLDGIDGLTCAQSIHLSITTLILCYLNSDIIHHVRLVIVLNILILSSSIAFLLFNWHPAKIFLGDIGSIALGFLLGASLLIISSTNLNLFLASVIASLYYWTDGGLTIIIRLINKENILEPHLNHFFQKAIQQGYTQVQVVKRIACSNILLMLLAIISLYHPFTASILAISVVYFRIMDFTQKTIIKNN